jgi:hypothetical protein
VLYPLSYGGRTLERSLAATACCLGVYASIHRGCRAPPPCGGAVSRLGDRYAEGYLSTDTLARRVEAAYGATTGDELEALELDLPRRWSWLRRRARRTIDLPATTAYVGRSSGCDIVIRDPTVSRVHARIDRTPSGWRIVDLDSTNGTRVNGCAISDSPLAPGDDLRIGAVTARTRR